MTGAGSDRGSPEDARGGSPEDDRRGSSGGARRDPWRGVRGESRGKPSAPPGAFGDSWTGHAELEELPAQPVLPRGSPRLGVSGTLAVVAIIALVASGFGLLGGRPDASPVPTTGGRPAASAAGPTPIIAASSPRVTPWAECNMVPFSAPRVLLEVNGRATAGSVEIVSWSTDAVVPGFSPGVATPTVAIPERVDVPVDVIAELWIAGGACAVAWNIDLAGGDVLDSLSNPAVDPAYAVQNRFDLSLYPYQGGDYELRAVLVFSTLVARATWPIRVLPFERPVATLHWGDVAMPVVEGCDITLSLGNGIDDELNSCGDDLNEGPGKAVMVRAGKRAVFSIPDWQVDAVVAICGRLSGHSFVAEPEPGCMVATEPGVGSAFFDARTKPGAWIIAISACASQFTASTNNRVCGTWYANVDVRA